MKTFSVNCEPVVWNGVSLTWGGINSVPLAREPTEEEVRLVLLGWGWGYNSGKQDGRNALQNEFKSLMGLWT